MSIYYKYAPDGSKIVVLSYVDDCVYWYSNEAIWKMVCGYLSQDIPCELLGIFTLVHVNKTFSDEGSLFFYISG